MASTKPAGTTVPKIVKSPATPATSSVKAAAPAMKPTVVPVAKPAAPVAKKILTPRKPKAVAAAPAPVIEKPVVVAETPVVEKIVLPAPVPAPVVAAVAAPVAAVVEAPVAALAVVEKAVEEIVAKAPVIETPVPAPVPAALASTTEKVEKLMNAIPHFEGYEEIAAFGKANFEALVEANSVLAKGIEEISNEIFERSFTAFESAAATTTALFGVKTLHDFVELNTSFTKAQYEKLVAATTKIGELTAKLATESAGPIKARATQVIETVSRPIA